MYQHHSSRARIWVTLTIALASWIAWARVPEKSELLQPKKTSRFSIDLLDNRVADVSLKETSFSRASAASAAENIPAHKASHPEREMRFMPTMIYFVVASREP